MAAKSQRQNGSEDESELKSERGTAAKTEKGHFLSILFLLLVQSLISQNVLQTSIQTRVHPSMSSSSSQPDRPRASQTDGDSKPSHHGGLSHTSIALICAFVVCFTFFLYLSSKAPRVSGPVRPSSVRQRRGAPRRRRPKLWDVWLDQDDPDELKPPRRTACNWRVSSPMLITKGLQ